jgi:hypothetical protein
MTTHLLLARLAAREKQRLIAQIQARRDSLAAEQRRAAQIVAELEQQLAYGREQILARAGGLQELDELLAALNE